MPLKEGRQLTDTTIESIAKAYSLENSRGGRGSGGSKKKKKERNADSLTSRTARTHAIEQAVQRRNEEIKQELLQVLSSLLSGFEGIQRQKTVQEYQEWLERQLFAQITIQASTTSDVAESISSLVLFTHDEIIVETHAKSSGPGGQNVNKVASAVRIQHLPTGITVEASADRSQLRNKTQALENLKERLLQHLAQWRALLDISDSTQDESLRLNQIEKLRAHIHGITAHIN